MPLPDGDNMLLAYEQGSEEMSDDNDKRDEFDHEQEEDVKTPPTACKECGGHSNEHAPDCETLLELERWALNEKRHRALYRAEKTPMGGIMPIDVDEVEELDPSSSEPMEIEDELLHDPLPDHLDLGWYFAQYGVDTLGQIAVCRTHANNLAALNRVTRDGSTGARPVGRPTTKGTGSKGAKRAKTINYGAASQQKHH